METKFKVGDRVKCIDDFGADAFLHKGYLYRLTNVKDGWVGLDIDKDPTSCRWWAGRFVLVKRSSRYQWKVGDKFIDTNSSRGEVYTITRDLGSDWYHNKHAYQYTTTGSSGVWLDDGDMERVYQTISGTTTMTSKTYGSTGSTLSWREEEVGYINEIEQDLKRIKYGK